MIHFEEEKTGLEKQKLPHVVKELDCATQGQYKVQL